MQVSQSNPEGVTVAQLCELLAAAELNQLGDDAVITARCKPEMRFDRAPIVLGITIMPKEEVKQ